MEIGIQAVQRIRMWNDLYLLHHTNTWECEEDISTSHTDTYVSPISQRELIKVEEIENDTGGGEAPENSSLLINNVANIGLIRILPILKNENVISQKRCTEESSVRQQTVIHGSVKISSCEQCEKTFAQNGHFNHHKFTHDAVKPFFCEQCDKRFVQKVQLRKHKFTHGGVKPLPCDQCAKRFVRKGDLKKHKATHDVVKPYYCDQCHKGFVQKSHFNMLTHNEVKPPLL